MSLPDRRLALIGACLVTIVAVGILVVNATGGSGAASPSAENDGDTPAALTTPVLSARRVPELVRSHILDERLSAAVEPLLARAPAESCVVVSDAGRVALWRRGDVPLAPASTQKILLADAVLGTFGPEHRLQTKALSATEPSDGVVEGDLYLVGGGDPLLTTPGYQRTLENPEQLSNDFAQLAEKIAAAGVREVRGGVVGDESRYDTVRTIPSWPGRYQADGHVGPLSALIVNDGSTGFTADPDNGESLRFPGEPATLAAETLITLLERRGVQVRGAASSGRAPTDAVEVASLPSLTVTDLVAELVADSDNTTAELLVKELGMQRSGSGTTAEGLRAVEEVLERSGLPTAGLSLVDGSGLDVGNRITCDLLVTALDRYGADSVVGRSLAVAGETGTLRRRMRDAPAQGRVHAKTGTLNTVNALAGFATTNGGTKLTFSYIANGPDQPGGYGPLDDFANALVSLDAGPSVEALSPRSSGP